MRIEINTDLNNYKYKSFISYSHSDEKWAKWLHKVLERYQVPSHLVGKENDVGKIPKRLHPVFRDRDELASATDLNTLIVDALDKSATQIVICSEKSAQSQWVNEEILNFKRFGKSHRIFCIIVSGEPYASTMPGRESEECFPKALRFQIDDDGNLTDIPAEPIAADVRPGKDGKTNAKIKLLAGVLGVGFDDLRQREQARKNRRLAIITASSFAGMLLAIGLATTAIIARNEAQEQRKRAEIEAETARQTSSFMVDLFAVSDPSEARGNTITAREILDKGAKRIESELADQPKIQATLMDTIGSVYTSLGLYNQAKPLLLTSLEKRKNLPEATDSEVANSLYNLAHLLTEQADLQDAKALYEDAITLLETSGENRKLLVTNYAGLAELYFRMSKYQEAEGLLVKVLKAQRDIFGDNSLEVAEATEELGLNYFDQGNYDESEKLLRQSLASRQILFDNKPHPDWASNLNNLGLLLQAKGNFDEADALYDQALEMSKILFGPEHPEVAIIYGNIAILNHLYTKDFSKAETMYRSAIAILKKAHGKSHPEIARLMNNLSHLIYNQGDHAVGIEMINNALEMAIESLGNQHEQVAVYSALKARWIAEQGRYQESISILKEALSIREKLLNKDHPSLLVTYLDLIESLLGSEDFQQAERYAKTIYDSQKERESERWLFHAAQGGYGAALAGLAEFEKAEKLLITSYEHLSNDDSVRPIFVKRSVRYLIKLYQLWGKPEQVTTFEEKLSALDS